MFRRYYQSFITRLASVAFVLTSAQQLLGAEPDQKTEEHNYPFSWAIVVLCLVLGLLVTLRPSGRTKDVRRPHTDG